MGAEREFSLQQKQLPAPSSPVHICVCTWQQLQGRGRQGLCPWALDTAVCSDVSLPFLAHHTDI